MEESRAEKLYERVSRVCIKNLGTLFPTGSAKDPVSGGFESGVLAFRVLVRCCCPGSSFADNTLHMTYPSLLRWIRAAPMTNQLSCDVAVGIKVLLWRVVFSGRFVSVCTTRLGQNR
ncbi:unnamed protein product [Brassica rapa subsp. narinosa]|uniref:Uncharacterized protein n=1 Tax=Brassica campestris TaxID=3711 RepID=M4FEY2_BRACM